jgi:hypothetical protein
MTVAVIVECVSVFSAGILAGAELVLHYGLYGPTAVLDDEQQVRLRQALILRLRWLVPAFFVPTAVAGIAAAAVDGTMPGFGFRCAGVLALVIWIVVRAIGTVPINSATVSWRPDAPPTNWRTRMNEAERFHIAGAWAATAAFGCFLLAVVVRLAG